MGNLVTTAIITKGLYNGPACVGIVTTHFSLLCKSLPRPKDTGGGPYPHVGAHNQIPNIQNFYHPVEDQPFLVPKDQEADYFRKFKAVELRIKFGEKEVVKEYRIPTNRAKYVVAVINLLNSTRDKIQVAVSGLKRLKHNIVVRVQNLHKR